MVMQKSATADGNIKQRFLTPPLLANLHICSDTRCYCSHSSVNAYAVHVLNSHDVFCGNGERTNTWYVQGQRHQLKAAHYSHPLAFTVYASEDHNVVPLTQVSLFQRDFSLRFLV